VSVGERHGADVDSDTEVVQHLIRTEVAEVAAFRDFAGDVLDLGPLLACSTLKIVVTGHSGHLPAENGNAAPKRQPCICQQAVLTGEVFGFDGSTLSIGAVPVETSGRVDAVAVFQSDHASSKV
jgi:hypothetical protein